jgi:hypothetical protein
MLRKFIPTADKYMNFKNNIIISYIVKLYKRWNRKITLSKRQQFVIVTLILSGGLITTQIIPADLRYLAVAIMSVIAYLLSALSLREDLKGIEWVTLLILPTLYTAAVCLFYFLLPSRWLTRIPIAILYAIGIYALLLTENIYNVAANRTIALLRAAHSVGFLITLVTYFFMIQTVLSSRTFFYINAPAVGIISFLLALQILWPMTLENRISDTVWAITITLSILLTQVAFILSFWPTTPTISALFMTTCFYCITGMGQQYLQEKLYKKTVSEFGIVIGIILIVFLISTNWRGNF